MRNIFIILYAIFICPDNILVSQRLDDSEWNKKIENGVFVEGTYSLPVSAALSLISFHGTFESVNASRDKKLHFVFHAPKKDNFLLKVQERKIKDYYMLESLPAYTKQGANTIGPWDINSFLKTFDIPTKNLAVLCRLNEDNQDYILPVSVLYDKGRDKSNNYSMIFRLAKKIQKGSCKVYLGEHKGKIPEDKLVQTKKIGRHPGGSVFQVSIDKKSLGNYEGWVTLYLSLSPSGSRKKTTSKFYFYHTK